MSDEERKMLAFLAKMVFNLSIGIGITHEEDLQLEKIFDKLGYYGDGIDMFDED